MSPYVSTQIPFFFELNPPWIFPVPWIPLPGQVRLLSDRKLVNLLQAFVHHYTSKLFLLPQTWAWDGHMHMGQNGQNMSKSKTWGPGAPQIVDDFSICMYVHVFPESV